MGAEEERWVVGGGGQSASGRRLRGQEPPTTDFPQQRVRSMVSYSTPRIVHTGNGKFIPEDIGTAWPPSFIAWLCAHGSTPVGRLPLNKGTNSAKIAFVPQKESLLGRFTPELDGEG